jgi:hypothetical protein
MCSARYSHDCSEYYERNVAALFNLPFVAAVIGPTLLAVVGGASTAPPTESMER